MNQGTINFILQQMTGCLNNSQMIRLQNTLNESLKLAEDRSTEMSSAELLESFLAVKRLEGRSDKTLALYRYNIGMIMDISEKNACVMNTDDIRRCLTQYQEEHGVKKQPLIMSAAIFPAFSDGWKMKTISSKVRFAGFTRSKRLYPSGIHTRMRNWKNCGMIAKNSATLLLSIC